MAHALPRRGAVTLLTAIAAAPAFAGAALDPDNPADVALALRKLRYRQDNGIVFWWIVGSKYLQDGPTLTPLFDLHVGTAMRVRTTPDGGFVATTLETVFYTDARGVPVETWTNPYTDEQLKVPIDSVGPVDQTYRPDGSPIPRTEIGGAALDSKMTTGPLLVAGDEVWVRNDSTAVVTARNAQARPFVVNDWATYSGRLSDIRNAGKAFAPAGVVLEEVTGFPRWMGMEGTKVARTANLFTRGVGRKVARYAEMPAVWRGLMAEHFPDIARDLAQAPDKALDRPPARFER
jgi:hypothetical protein